MGWPTIFLTFFFFNPGWHLLAILPSLCVLWEFTSLLYGLWPILVGSLEKNSILLFPRILVDRLSCTEVLHESLCPPEYNDKGT